MSKTFVCKYPEQGACMRRKREEKGWTRVELACRSGVSISTIENLENGYFSGSVTTVRLLAKTLKITIDEYVGNN